MAEQLKEYHSSFTGQEVDELLTKVKDGSVTADIEKELAEKADKSGYYPQLHVGLSDNLPDRGDVTEGLIGFRESAGADNSIEDGTANVQELLGESVVWNQIATISGLNSTFSKNGDKYVATPTSTPSTPGNMSSSSGRLRLLPNCVANHVYLYDFGFTRLSKREDIDDFTPTNMAVLIGSKSLFYEANIGEKKHINGISTAQDTSYIAVSLNDCVCEIDSPILIDLTKMFGAGKEPSTIEEFNAIKNQLVGVDFNAYNEGEVLGVNIKGIKSVNDNAFNGEYAKVLGGREYCADGTITGMGFAKEIGGTTEAIVLDGENKFIPSENGYVYASGTDICIHLVHTGYKDHVYTEHEVSESSFDLTPYFPNGMHGIGDVRDSVTPKKATQRIGIRDYIEGDENDTLVMTDGKKTIYVLATPIETEIDPQLNMNYKVWDFGTEELLTDSKSAPVLARTIYGFNATDTIRGNKAKNEEQDVRLHTLESEVVRIGDYQPDLSVGVADQLAGQDEPTASEINFRRSGGGAILDGNARIEAIKGNSVVWNQLWDINGDNRVDNVAYMTINEREVVLTIQSTGKNSRIRTSYTIGVEGHKYYVTYQAKYNSKSDDSSLIAFVGMSNFYANQLPLTNSYQTYSGVWIGDYAGMMNVGVIGTRNDGDIVSFKDIKVIDLTQMFGAGNEPTTIEDFYARIPMGIDLNAYNEGEVIHMTAKGIKSVGDNAWDEKWEVGQISASNGQNGLIDQTIAIRSKNYIEVLPNQQYAIISPVNILVLGYDAQLNYTGYLRYGGVSQNFYTQSTTAYIKFCTFNANYGTTYNNDIMISLVHSGWKQDTDAGYQPYWQDTLPLPIIRKYFPDGMKSVGTAHDEIRHNKATQKWEYSKGKIKSVDMGALNWGYANNAGWGTGFYANLIAQKNNSAPIVLSDCYLGISADSIYGANVNADKIITIEDGRVVRVHDSSYTDAATFKVAMSGVMFYYESNDWEWVELDKEDQLRNFDYQVWNCGTEQAIANVPSTPLKADIVYGFNAYGTIKQLKEQMATLMTQMAQMQTAMASVTSNNNN